jgi:Domain of unknown function (DUF4926)
MGDRPQLLAAVAALEDLPEASLPGGQVGTVVELLDDATALVEFSDDAGQAYALLPVLHYEPAAA